jgi:hypothetical protein
LGDWDEDEPEPVERFTEEEMAFLRFARFGELPPRARPSEWVETVETEQPSLPTRQRFDLGPDGVPPGG